MSLPAGVKESKCKSCGAAVIWAGTRKGKSMPVDHPPSAAGDLVLLMHDGKVMVERYSERVHPSLAPRRTSHFSTCPNAKEHRR